MSVLTRFANIMSANINALLDKAENPEKMIDQTLRNLRENLAQVKKETANVIANEKSAKRKVEEYQVEVDKYNNAAVNAVSQGNDDDARTLLEKVSVMEATLAEYRKNYQVAHDNAEKMRQMHDKLVVDIESLDGRRDMIKAKVATAKARDTANKIVSGTANSASSIEVFNKYEAKADKMLDAAEAMAELNEKPVDAAETLADKYGGANAVDVDAKLAAIKAKLGK